ncbi:hypothetical protein IMCC26256_112342 [Actinobacteria bacterium IMCC26256]|nr:hypothetical protein IMCC26256_112342 [Actinobacteria bacterium IMCC26256]
MRKQALIITSALLAFAVIIGFGAQAISEDSSEEKKQPDKMAQSMDVYTGYFGEVSGDGVLAAAISSHGPIPVGVTAQPIIGGDDLSMAAERCAEVALKGVDISLLATGTLEGKDVAIIVASKTPATDAEIAYVTDLDQCTIIYSERL